MSRFNSLPNSVAVQSPFAPTVDTRASSGIRAVQQPLVEHDDLTRKKR